MDVGTLRLDPTEENAAIEQIAWIVCDRDWSRCEKHRILVVANFDRVDCDSADEAAAQVAEIDFSFDLTFEQGRDHAPHALLAHARMRDANEAQHDNHDQPEQDDRAADGDAETPGHSREVRSGRRQPGLESLTDREAERELAPKTVVLRRLIRRGTDAARLLNDARRIPIRIVRDVCLDGVERTNAQ